MLHNQDATNRRQPTAVSERRWYILLSNLYLKLRELIHREDDEEGQGMVEYALILVLIAVVVIVVLMLLGNQINNVFSNISGGLGT
jgi:pilus assembly protein Flp/PilA